MTDGTTAEQTDALVIGAGPAGLMAADVLSAAGYRVLLAEAMPSPARKFLMAGKSGLNLTKDQPMPSFLAAYAEAADWLAPMVGAFGPAEVRAWAEGLGQAMFTGSSGRVFPQVMKASPLLRAWLGRLAGQGVRMQTRWRWQGWQAERAVFSTPEGARQVEARVTVLALGGASWARLGSNGGWTGILADAGVALVPFQAANVGLRVDWSPHMARHFGQPVKGAAIHVGDRVHRGEFVISRDGLEGGGIYAISRAAREGAMLVLDLAPDLGPGALAARLARPRAKQSLGNHLRRAGLGPVQIALLREWAGTLPEEAQALAALIKALPVRHQGVRPMDQAISVAGGVPAAALDPGLMLRARPGVFCAGEMLDWEAPTGGYLLTACLATGRWAGRAAARLMG
ncbi:MAG: TIGR03862 family flavoprotein [Qingshengfaniella sp.]